jgi:protein tyrosine phosphatase
MNDHVKFDYNKITDHIYLGTNSCCTVHFDKELLSKGIKADISVEGEKLDQPFGVKYFLWLPTIDHEAPTVDALALGAQTITYLVSRKMPVYVHCQNGHGRGPTVVAAYFISTGMTVDKAISTVAKKRPEIHIEDVQKKALESFAQKLKW